MKRLAQFLQEMKVIKGGHHLYWQVRNWPELLAVFKKVGKPKYHDPQMLHALQIDTSYTVLRAAFANGKVYVWDGYDGLLHDDAMRELGLYDEPEDEDTDDNLYLSYNGNNLVVESNYNPIGMSNPILRKLLAEYLGKVIFRTIPVLR